MVYPGIAVKLHFLYVDGVALMNGEQQIGFVPRNGYQLFVNASVKVTLRVEPVPRFQRDFVSAQAVDGSSFG